MELARKIEANRVTITRCVSELLANKGFVIDKPGRSDEPTVDSRELFAQIGQLKVES